MVGVLKVGRLSQFDKSCNKITRNLYDVFALPGFYALLVGSCLPTFRDSLSVPCLGIKQSSLTDPEDKSNTFLPTSVIIYQYTQRVILEDMEI
jgi:hypothetical protein